MRTRLVYTLAAASLLAASAVSAKYLIDGTKLRPWLSGRHPSAQQMKQIHERNQAQAVSRLTYNNVANPFVPTASRVASLNPDILPNDVIDDGTRLNVNVVDWYLGEFLGMGTIRPVYGTPLHSIIPDQFSGAAYEIHKLNGFVYADGKIYGNQYQSGGGQVIQASLYRYNAETFELEKEYTLDTQWSSVFDYAAYNPKTGKIIVIGYDARKTPYLSEFDPESGTYRYLVFCPVNLVAMAFDAEGQLYMVTRDGELQLVDINTGTGTPLFRVLPDGQQANYWNNLAFDYHTGELFWLRCKDDFYSELNRIDIERKQVELVSPMGNLGVLGMWVTSPEAPAEAPNTIASLSVDFGSQGGKIGTVHVKAPSTTFSGTPLSGPLTLSLNVDGSDRGTISLEAGATGKFDNIDFIRSGEHKTTVTVNNAAGASPAGSIIAYCGPDTPEAVTDVRLAVADDGTASLSWTAPSGGIHNGYFDPALLTYDVTRMPGNVKVAEALKSTSFSEKLPDTLDRYWYEVTVACDGIAGEKTASNSIVYGDGMSIPFDSALGGDYFNLATIYDLDGDGNTFYETWGSASVYTGYSQEFYQSDDWYITAPLYLPAGNYFVETTLAALGDFVDLDFTFGKGQTPEAQTTVLKTYTGLAYDMNQQAYKTYISVPESGKYYFGYHYYASTQNFATMPYLSIRSLKVSEGPADSAPGEVTELSGETFPKAELKNKITFTTPSVNFKGEPLSSLDRVEICDASGSVIGSVSNVQPGKQYTYIHEDAAPGYNEYTIYACNSAGRGKQMSLTVYAGDDIPGLVSYLKYTVTDNNKVDFEWGEPSQTGLNGSYVNLADVTYDFCRSENDYSEPSPVDGGRNLTRRSFSVDESERPMWIGDGQNFYLYGIIAKTPTGEGPLGYTGIILGDTYHAPFRESVANGFTSTTLWSQQLLDGATAWGMSTGDSELAIQASDNDGGLMLFKPTAEGNTLEAIVTPVFALKEMQNPVLIIDFHHNPAASEQAGVSIQINRNDAPFDPLHAIAAKGEEGWKEYKMSLNSYNDNDRLTIAFLGIATSGASDWFGIDNIRICDDVAHDLAISSVSAPAELDLAEAGIFEVQVESKGMETVENYAIGIYSDGIRVAGAKGAAIESGASATVKVEVIPQAVHCGREVEYEARIELESDENELNDSASTTVRVGGSDLPAPEGLQGKAEDGKITLSWNAPAPARAEKRTESFESYTSFAITGEGGWRFIDRDLLSPYGIQDIYYPNMASARAYMIWAPGELADFPGKNAWMPRTGNKCLIAFASSMYKINGDLDFEMQSDEWLISPHVAGGSTLSFWATPAAADNTEKFEVLVSYSGRAPEDFTPLGETVTITETGWKQYTYELPADAAYFAIHYVSSGYESFALLLDDFEFTAGYSETELHGYHVYANGARMTETPVELLSHSIAHDENRDNKYAVSAVYYEGESEPAMIEISAGVESIAQAGGTIITVEGRKAIVSTQCGATVSVYDSLGRLVATARAADGRAVIDLPSAGVYVARTGRHAEKFIVK